MSWHGPPGAGIEAFARQVYSEGTDPLEFAEVLVQAVAEAALSYDTKLSQIMAPGQIENFAAVMARRILGSLLDAGWTTPTGPGDP